MEHGVDMSDFFVQVMERIVPDSSTLSPLTLSLVKNISLTLEVRRLKRGSGIEQSNLADVAPKPPI